MSPVVFPACTRDQGPSANRAQLSTRLLSVELMVTLTPPRYQLTESHQNRDIWANSSCILIVVLSGEDEDSDVPSVSVAQCKLDYQACITGKKIAVKCAGMCPCPSQPHQSSAEKKGMRFCTHGCTLQASAGSKPMLNPCPVAIKPF